MSTMFANAGRNRRFNLDQSDRSSVSLAGGESVAVLPSASANTLMIAGISLRSTGVEATQTPSRQWLRTTFRCSGCRVTLSDAPLPLASGTVSRFGIAAMILSMPLGSGNVDRHGWRDSDRNLPIVTS